MATPLSYRAFVFLRRLREQRSRFLDVVPVKPRPEKGAQIQLQFRGKAETGHVTSIEPEGWADRWQNMIYAASA